MEAMRVSWTDERLDDLNHRIDDLNREMHAEFRELRREIKTMQATMIGGFVTLLATMVATQL
jgi:hypothetical protein